MYCLESLKIKKGFSLVELIVSLLISLLILSLVIELEKRVLNTLSKQKKIYLNHKVNRELVLSLLSEFSNDKNFTMKVSKNLVKNLSDNPANQLIFNSDNKKQNIKHIDSIILRDLKNLSSKYQFGFQQGSELDVGFYMQKISKIAKSNTSQYAKTLLKQLFSGELNIGDSFFLLLQFNNKTILIDKDCLNNIFFDKVCCYFFDNFDEVKREINFYIFLVDFTFFYLKKNSATHPSFILYKKKNSKRSIRITSGISDFKLIKINGESILEYMIDNNCYYLNLH